MQTIISAHNTQTTKIAQNKPNTKTSCNCKEKESCPMYMTNYICCASGGPFKTRYNNHTKSFRND